MKRILLDTCAILSLMVALQAIAEEIPFAVTGEEARPWMAAPIYTNSTGADVTVAVANLGGALHYWSNSPNDDCLQDPCGYFINNPPCPYPNGDNLGPCGIQNIEGCNCMSLGARIDPDGGTWNIGCGGSRVLHPDQSLMLGINDHAWFYYDNFGTYTGTLVVTTSIVSPFRVTSGTHTETENLEQAVSNEFGSNYRIADWNDIVAYCASHSVDDFISSISWQLGEENSLIVTRDGQHFYGGGNRHYYATRFDHIPNPWYLIHANIDNNHITLGSWMGLHMPILCIGGDCPNGSMSGFVENELHQRLVGADVTLHRTDQPGTDYNVQTNGSGDYSFPSVIAGTYTIIVQMAGYQTINQPNWQIDCGQTPYLGLMMHPDAPPIDPLLALYAPILHYSNTDLDHGWIPTEVQMMTDASELEQCPRWNPIPLSCDVINSSPSPSSLVRDGDDDHQWLVMRDPENSSAADYTPTVYCRRTQKWDGSNIVLQYYLFYPYNDYYFAAVFDMDHEGDWEFVEVELDQSGQQVLNVVTGVHWFFNQKQPADITWTGTHPNVWVATGSHASYLTNTCPLSVGNFIPDAVATTILIAYGVPATVGAGVAATLARVGIAVSAAQAKLLIAKVIVMLGHEGLNHLVRAVENDLPQPLVDLWDAFSRTAPLDQISDNSQHSPDQYNLVPFDESRGWARWRGHWGSYLVAGHGPFYNGPRGPISQWEYSNPMFLLIVPRPLPFGDFGIHPLFVVDLALGSPARLSVVDGTGRRVGNVEGNTIDETGNSFYFAYADSQWLNLYEPEDGQYRIVLEGTAAGMYHLTMRTSESAEREQFYTEGPMWIGRTVEIPFQLASDSQGGHHIDIVPPAENSCNDQSPQTYTATALLPPTLTAPMTASGLRLQWTRVPGADFYQILRGQQFDQFEPVETSFDTSWVESPGILTGSPRGFYQIIAKRAVSETLQPDQTDLLAYWVMEEGSGVTAWDVSGNGHEATLHNADWYEYSVDSHMCFGLGFGNNKWADVANHDMFYMAPLQIDAHMKIDELPAGSPSYIIGNSRYAPLNGGFSWRIEPDGKLVAMAWNGNSWNQLRSVVPIMLGEWLTATLIISGDESLMLVDGTVVAAGRLLFSSPNNEMPLTIGASALPNGAHQYFLRGQIAWMKMRELIHP
ncbi:carboxypeptidase regulatory-like domain-containing protein [candidate division KSB1 bacterium]|nr:carboxypeptidase regulatory-like domain-containing protein [candidate division KSB1 bacterium]